LATTSAPLVIPFTAGLFLSSAKCDSRLGYQYASGEDPG